MYTKYTKDSIQTAVNNSKSFYDMARFFGKDPKQSGSVITRYRELTVKFNVDTSHFTGQGWNKNNYSLNRFRKGVRWSSSMLNALMSIKGNKCEHCGLSEWFGLPLSLECHHIDSNKFNNEVDNLQLLCPNCHSNTPGWRGKKFE